MRDNEYEWDDEKAAANLAWHRVSFETARRAFDDPFAVSRGDPREDYGEELYILLGMVDDRSAARRLHLPRRSNQDHLGPHCRATGTTAVS